MTNKVVCTQCGYVGSAKRAIKGNGLIEIILWFCFLVPGIIYSIWRSSSRFKICPKCSGSTLIPIDSPRAKTIMAEHMTKEEISNIVEEQSNTDFKSKNLLWLNWFKNHPLWSLAILFIGLPFVFGMISAIVNPN